MRLFQATRRILLHQGHQYQDGASLRAWFAAYILYMVLLTAVASGSLYHPEWFAGRWWEQAWLLTIYLFYLSLCCTFFPAPTAWIVLLMGSPLAPLDISNTGNAFLDSAVRVVVVAGVGALGTAMANLNEYHIITYLLRFRQFYRIRDTRFYRAVSRWFDLSPFLLITVISFIPLPVDVVRWLAITRRYPRWRYFIAYYLGRFGRYGLLAGTAVSLQIGWKGIVAIQAAFIGLLLLRFLPPLVRMWRSREKEGGAIPES